MQTETMRLAMAADIGLFQLFIEAYLVEMRSKGSEIRPTPQSVDFYCGLFCRYVEEEVDGAVIICSDGFSMAGDATTALDTDFGKTAIGWGTYVTPSARGRSLGTALRRELRHQLRLKGFKTVLGGVNLGDNTGLESVSRTGWKPYMLQGYDDLGRGD